MKENRKDLLEKWMQTHVLFRKQGELHAIPQMSVSEFLERAKALREEDLSVHLLIGEVVRREGESEFLWESRKSFLRLRHRTEECFYLESDNSLQLFRSSVSLDGARQPGAIPGTENPPSGEPVTSKGKSK